MSGRDFLEHGGSTSCVALARDGEAPSLILDAGTGIRNLDKVLDGTPFRGAIALGHLHWDHTQGLPFFHAADNDDAEVRLVMPAQGPAADVLRRMMSPPFFPIEPEDLRGQWTFESLEPGIVELGGFTVTARDIPHKGGRAFGYRVEDTTAKIAYLSDHSPTSLGTGNDGLGEMHDDAVELCRGVDLLIHDSQHTSAELPEKAFLGHSSAAYAVTLAAAAGASEVLLFHHDPQRTDREIDALVDELAGGDVVVNAAREGTTIDLPRRGSP
ncbi:MAG: MBL fold metallo-hydrolase [Actinomycetota bacterium]|nr:MBL fold metallo-hydrolase [Actinomycetota bacterium]